MSDPAASSNRGSSHPVAWTLFWFLFLWIGINLLSMLFSLTPISPFTLSGLLARTVALPLRVTMGELEDSTLPDWDQLAHEVELTPGQAKAFFTARASLRPDYFDRFGRMGLCALRFDQMLRLGIWRPYYPQEVARRCLEHLQNLRGETLTERLARFAETVDGFEVRGQLMFVDQVLAAATGRSHTGRQPDRAAGAAAQEPSQNSPASGIDVEEPQGIIGPDSEEPIIEPQ